MSDTVTRVQLKGREIILVGTAHISQESVEEVKGIIAEEHPDRVCVEIDDTRFRTLKEGQKWSQLNIRDVLKKGQGFLLMANLVLSSFQRRMGAGLGISPGDEMKAAVQAAEEAGIPYSFCDREIQITLRRAWKKSGFWSKNKMLAAMFSAILSNEEVSEEDLAELKKRSALDDMMTELAGYLPSVKEVLIDERDQYLATKIFESEGRKVVAVIGAGHASGLAGWLERLDAKEAEADLEAISRIPPPSRFNRILPWIIPVIVAALIGSGFLRSGWQQGLDMLWMWILVNGTLSAVGALAALAHPVTILLSFLAAPVTSMNPTIGVGIVTGLIESNLRKPRVIDFENLHEDVMHVKGFYRNRLTRILLVFFFSSIGSAVGTFIGIPYLATLIGG